MIRITSRRLTPRRQDRADVKVYTNARRVELIVDGVALPEMVATDHVAIWHDVPLKDGSNRLVAIGDAGVRDAVEWRVIPNGE